jgi:hypothetical protein
VFGSSRSWLRFRLLAGLEIFLLVAALVAPVAVAGETPTPGPDSTPAASIDSGTQSPGDSASLPPDAPTDAPTAAPTDAPTAPTDQPTAAPILEPTQAPTEQPTAAPTDVATETPATTEQPTAGPTLAPSPVATVSLIVRFLGGTSTAEMNASVAADGGVQTHAIDVLHLRTIDVPADQAAAIRAAYLDDPAVASVESDHVRTAGALANDPQIGSQWNLTQIGWGVARDSASPSGRAVIAILDTGVDASHPDLAGHVLAGFSAIGGNPSTDPNGHGTEMAGIAAASVDNGTGIAGVAYGGVSLLPVQVLGANGTGEDSDIIAGVVWAADHGANVILMSFSNPGYSAALQSAIAYAWSKNVVVVAATGNDGSGVATYPAGDTYAIGVSATDQNDNLAASSNFGADTFIAAPGVDIPATEAGGGYTSVSGTSASAAEVAGAAALLFALDPSLSNSQVIGRLARTADPADTASQTGNGRLNLGRAVADTGTEGVTPAGAPGGGPLVGPYVAATITVKTVSLGSQSVPLTYATAGAATFAIAISYNGGGNCSTPGAFSASGLPGGATALFTPASIGNCTTTAASVQISTTSATPAGTFSFTVTLGGSSGNGNLVIAKRPLAVSGITANDKTYDGTTAVTLNTSGAALVGIASGDSVTLVATGATGTFSDKNVGSAKSVAISGLTISGASAANYSLTQPSATASISPAPLTATITGSQVYGGIPSFSPAYSGFVNGENSGVVSGALTGCSTSATSTSPVGSGYTISGCSGLSSANYTISYSYGAFSVNAKALTITANGQTKTYGATFTFAGTEFGTSGLINGDTVTSVTLTSAGSAATAVVGSYNIVPSAAVGSGLGNYSISYTNGTMSVGKAVLTVTANNASKTYGAANPAFSAGYSGFLNGDTSSVLGGSPSLTTTATTGSPVGTYPINAAQGTLSAANYSFSFVAGTLTVTQKALSVNAAAASKTYGAADPTFNWTYSGFASGDSAGNSGITGGASCSRVSGESVGTYAITCAPGTLAAPNYTFVTGGPANLTIGKAVLSVNAEASSKTYFDGDPSFTWTYSGFVPGDNAGNSGITGAATCSRTTGETAGTYVITCAPGTLASPSYTFATGSTAVFTINPAPLAVNAVAASKTYGAADPTFTWTYSGFLDHENAGNTHVSGNASCARTPGETVAGSPYSITCTPGTLTMSSPNYYFTTGTSAAFTINPKALTITASSQSKTYGAAFSFAGTEFTTNGLVSGDSVSSVTLTSAGGAATAGVGNYSIVPSAALGTGLGNYTISYANGTLTVNSKALAITAASLSKTYGATFTFAGTEFTTSGLTNGDAVASVTLTSAGAPASASVGGYSIVPSAALGTGLGNYSITYVDGTLTVGPAVLTIMADSSSKTYGETVTFAGTEFGISGLVNGDTVTSVTLTSGGADATANVGGYDIVPSAAVGTGLSNYLITYDNGTLTVNPKAATVVAEAESKTYGDDNPALSAVVTGAVNGDTIHFTLATTALKFSGVGNYPITITLGSNPNYNVTPTDGTLSITAKDATVVANNATKTYGQTVTFAGTEFGTSGFVNGDSVASVTLSSDGAAATANAGSFDIVPSDAVGTGLGNYHITFVNGTLSVGKAVLTVTANDKSRVYGAPDPSFDATIGGFMNGDTQAVVSGSPTCTTTALVASPVGPYPISCDVSGMSAANYSFSPVDGTLTVGPAVLTITAKDATKTYGDTVMFAGTEFTTSGLTNGDTVTSVTLASDGAAATANVGSFDIVPSDAVGTGLGNYSIHYANGTLSITAKDATVTANAKTKTYGDDNPSFDATVTGTVNGDVLNYTLATTALKFSDVGTYPITVTLGSNPNYTVTSTDGILSINQKAATVIADNKSRTYGDDNPALTATVTGTVNGDTLDYTLATTALQFSGVGDYPITVTLGSNPNYTVTPTNGTLNIGPKAATVAADPLTKIYGDDNPTLTATVGGTVNGDVLDFTLATTALKFSGVGHYPITVTLGSNPNYSVTPTDGTLSINPKAASVTANAKTKTYGEANPALDATVTGTVNGDTLNFTLATSALQFSNVGSYPITVTLGSNPNYTVATTDALLAVTPKAASIVANAQTKVYGEANPTLTATVTGTVNGDTLAYSLATTAETFSGVGTYPITVTLGSNPNYTVTPTDGTLSITPKAASVTANDKSKTYGDANPALDATVAGTVNGDTLNFTLATTAETFSGVATYPITVTLGSNPNYTVTPTNGTLTVDPKDATVTANAKFKTYGDDNPVFDATVTGTVNGDVLNYTVDSAAAKFSGVGTYPITVTLGSNPNYTVTPANGTLTVNQKAATVIADNKSKTYGDPNPALTATVTGTVNGDTLDYTLATTALQFSGVADYPITVSLGSNPNYTVTPTDGTLSITPKDATVTANAKTKVYGDDNPDLTATVTGTVNGDILNYTLATTALQFSNVGDYPISVTLGSNPNYTVTPTDGTLAITPKAASVIPNAASKVYGTADPVFTGTLTGFLPADLVTATYTRTSGETVAGGPYTISATLAPAGVLGNYAIAYSTANFTITPAAASVSPNAAGKVYGTADPVLTGSLTGFLPADGVTASYSRTAGETVLGGPYTISATLSPSAVLSNYTITNNTAVFTITRADASVTPNAATKVYGTADPALTGILSGFLVADDVAATYSRTAGDTVLGGPYTISATLSPAAVLSNYNITYNTANFTITQAATTTTITNAGTLAANSSVAGTAYAVAVSVTSSGPVTGTVTVTDNDATPKQCVITLLAGSGSCSLSSTTAGTRTITATFSGDSNTLTSSTTAGHPVIAAAPAALAFASQPSGTESNATIAPAVQVQVTDAYGNPTKTLGAFITLSITPGTPAGGSGALGGMLTRTTDSTGLATFPDLSIDGVGGAFQLRAIHSSYGSIDSAPFDVDLGSLIGSVSAADATFIGIDDGFNVLFTKGGTSSVMTLKNTDPGTLHYLLTFQNETGIALNSGNGASSTAIITIPGVPSSGLNVPLPGSTAGLTDPAFIMQGSRPVRVHADFNWWGEINTQVWWASSATGGDCTAAGINWIPGQPADGAAVKCIKVGGFAIPRHHRATIDVNLEFRLKNTTGWDASKNPQLNFRGGFAFKSDSTITLDKSLGGHLSGSYPGNEITGIVGVGQQATAIGGFVFDTNGNGISGATVRVYNTPPSPLNLCSASGEVAEYTTGPDGFYFVSQKGFNDSGTSATGGNPLPYGVAYYVAVCGIAGIDSLYWPARLVDHKLTYKEFDDEDFYVSSPSHIVITGQPSSGRVGRTLSSIQVAVTDSYGYTVTADNSTVITITPAGGLTGTLSRTASHGVVSFNDLKFLTPGTYILTITSSPNWGGGDTSSRIVITP